MKILVIGSGGREHAIVMKLAESTKLTNIYCTPGNGGISKYAQCFDISATDISGIVNLTKKLEIDLVVVTPDNPLVLGMVDALEQEGIMTFGPNKRAAQIEGSKIFAKNLMMKYNIPTGKYEAFSNIEEANHYIAKNKEYPIVIKADGLALGKGVVIANNKEEARLAVKAMMQDEVFGVSGKNIIIEEFLTGPEVSMLCFTDGKTIIPMISSMDHKRSLDNDEGLNTGGMGAIAPNPFYTEKIAKECMDRIYIPTINAMAKENAKFKGCLYFGLILTENGPKVIEYNCRFGDPEAQVVLSLLKTDLLEIMDAIYYEKLNDITIEWYEGASACVILVSDGYPQKYETAKIIKGLNSDGQIEKINVYHAGTKLDNNNFITSGGRVLGITATGKNLEEALTIVYKELSNISYSNIYFRHDIGKKALCYKKV